MMTDLLLHMAKTTLALALLTPLLALTPPQRVPPGDLTQWLREHPLSPGTSLLLEPGDHTLSETLRLGPSAAGLHVRGGGPGTRVSGGFAVPASAWQVDMTQDGAQIWSARPRSRSPSA